MAEDLLNLLQLHLQAFWQNFKNGKMHKFGFCYETFKNLLLQNYSKFLDIAHK